MSQGLTLYKETTENRSPADQLGLKKESHPHERLNPREQQRVQAGQDAINFNSTASKGAVGSDKGSTTEVELQTGGQRVIREDPDRKGVLHLMQLRQNYTDSEGGQPEGGGRMGSGGSRSTEGRSSQRPRLILFSVAQYERKHLKDANKTYGMELVLRHDRLSERNVHKAKGFPALSCFVDDDLSEKILSQLPDLKVIAVRATGTDNVDTSYCKKRGITVLNVQGYNPTAIAEHAVALMLALNRHVAQAHVRAREFDFDLKGNVGFNMKGKTVGIVGTGQIGAETALILLKGFGCKIIAYDIKQNDNLVKEGVRYATMEELCSESDIISLHAPLTPQTKYMISAETIKRMKRGVMLVNTSRGQLVDTQAVLDGLKSGQVGYLGMDVYEHEKRLFFRDHSGEIIQDDLLARLVTLPNVVITGHQAFLTQESLVAIEQGTLKNVQDWYQGKGRTPQSKL